MFGPAFLVAPVTEQGAIARTVYLPAGTDWFDYWTGEGAGVSSIQGRTEHLPCIRMTA